MESGSLSSRADGTDRISGIPEGRGAEAQSRSELKAAAEAGFSQRPEQEPGADRVWGSRGIGSARAVVTGNRAGDAARPAVHEAAVSSFLGVLSRTAAFVPMIPSIDTSSSISGQ